VKSSGEKPWWDMIILPEEMLNVSYRGFRKEDMSMSALNDGFFEMAASNIFCKRPGAACTSKAVGIPRRTSQNASVISRV